MRSLKLMLLLCVLSGLSFALTSVSSCSVISSPDTYMLNTNLVGASVDASEISDLSWACIKIASSDVILDCNGYNMTDNGTVDSAAILVNGSNSVNYTNVTIQNCGSIALYDNGVYLHTTASDNVNNVNVYGGGVTTNAFYVMNSSFNTLTNNNAYQSTTGYKIVATPSSEFSYHTLLNNSAYNGSFGFQIANDHYNNVTGNLASNNTNAGFRLANSSNNNITDNIAEYSMIGFEITSSPISFCNSTFRNNTARFNPSNGFEIYSEHNNVFIGNTAHDNGNGFFLDLGADNNTFNGDRAYNNTFGFRTSRVSTNNSLTDCVFFNNSFFDIYLYNRFALSTFSFNMTNTLLLEPSGTMNNYTNISLHDTLALNTEYGLKWAASPPAPPLTSFGQKFVNISTGFGPTYMDTIDTITWHWADSEPGAGNESLFQIWKYNASGWDATALNDTPNTAANTLSLHNHKPSSVYAILQNGTVNLTSNFSITKTDQTTNPVSPGGIVSFDIIITNTGTSTLSTIAVSDFLPAGLTFSSASPTQDSVNGQNITWNNVGPLAGSASTVISVNATVDSGIVDSGTPIIDLTNTANASSGNLTGQDSDNVTIYYSNNSIDKQDITPAISSLGGIVEYLLNVTNTGNTTLNPVYVLDEIPTGLTYVQATPVPLSVAGQNVTWNAGPLAPGASTLIYLNVTGVSIGNYTNNASVTGVPPNGDNVTDSDDAVSSVVPASFVLNKSVNQTTVEQGNNVTYSVNITNNGTTNITVSILDILPAGVTFVAASTTPDNVTGQILRWNSFTTIAPGSSFELTYNVTVNAVGNHTNDVSVVGAPPNGNNISANDSVTFNSTAAPGGGSSGDGTSPDHFNVEAYAGGCSTPTVINVTDSGSGVEDANVVVFEKNTLADVFSGTTNGSGQVVFDHCGVPIRIHVSKSGYYPESIETTITCAQCVGPDICLSDADCPMYPIKYDCVRSACILLDCEFEPQT